MERLTWQTTQKRVNDLIPQEINPRKISDKQMSDLKKNLKKFNLVEIPAVDYDGTIIAGHQRVAALKLLGRGEEVIDVRIPNRKLTKEERGRYLIASNALGGDWDFEKLKIFETDLLIDIGFDPIELFDVWDKNNSTKEDNFNIEKEIKKIEDPQIKQGDLIILGRHKLLCGDSTKPKNLTKLFETEKASMVYSDPVYNINIDYNKGIGGKNNYGGNVNDSRTDESYRKFIKSSLNCALSVVKEDAHIFYWADQKYIWLFQTLYKKLGIQNKRVCLWVKNGHNPTPNVAFNKCYEPCIYGTIGNPYLSSKKDLNEILNKEVNNGNQLFDDIWTIKRLPKKEYQHATSKPPELHEKAILRCTKVNDIILDSFSGSGSTLIAAEQLNRRFYGVELEPVFCRLIINRWEKLTGKKAEIRKDGEAC